MQIKNEAERQEFGKHLKNLNKNRLKEMGINSIEKVPNQLKYTVTLSNRDIYITWHNSISDKGPTTLSSTAQNTQNRMDFGSFLL